MFLPVQQGPVPDSNPIYSWYRDAAGKKERCTAGGGFSFISDYVTLLQLTGNK